MSDPEGSSNGIKKPTQQDELETTIAYHTSSDKSSSTNVVNNSNKNNNKNLSGMNLVHHVCRKRKIIYDNCSSNWYKTEFMTGKSLHQGEICGDKFDLYRKCILKGIRKEIWEKKYNLPTPKDGSPLLDIDE